MDASYECALSTMMLLELQEEKDSKYHAGHSKGASEEYRAVRKRRSLSHLHIQDRTG
jgi:hypothetical protein